jgi:lipopolysaccharide export system permease protein
MVVRLLDRYLLRELLVPLGYCLGGFLIFWISCDLVSELGHFQKQRLRAVDIAEYYSLKTPELLMVVVPVALLLALLYALTNHARHHELTAMRAAGVGLWRISLPYLVVGFVLSVELFALNEFWVPEASERAEAILSRYQAKRSNPRGEWETNLFFVNLADNRSWEIGAYNLKTRTMASPKLGWRLPEGTRHEIYARQAIWTNGMWVFYEVQRFDYPASGTDIPTVSRTNELAMPDLSERPGRIKSEIKISRLNVLALAFAGGLTEESFAGNKMAPSLGHALDLPGCGPDRASVWRGISTS